MPRSPFYRVLQPFVLLFHLTVSQNVIKVSVREKTASDHIITNLISSANLRERYRDTYKSFRYALMKDEQVNYFKLSPEESSLLRVNKEIVITELCKKNKLCCPRKKNHSDCKIMVHVNANKGSVTAVSLEVEVTIEDINDNGCTFSESNYSVTFLENQERGENSIPYPYDQDLKFPVKKSRIRLDPPTGHPFSLKIKELTTTRPPFRVSLVHKGGLDREKQSHYTLRVLADDGVDSHACSMTVNIFVGDANDNYPVFDQNLYSINVSELTGRDGTTTLPAPLLRVRASDKDIGRNAELRYSIGSEVTEIGSIFTVNELTGEVLLLKPLSYKDESSFTFTVVARDSGRLNPNTGTTTVSISIIDENDNSPKITLRNKDGGKDITIPEEVAKRVSVATILVTDADSGNNGRFNCSMVEYNNTKSFAFHRMGSKNSYQVISERAFDREVSPVAYFTIICVDGGQPAQRTTRKVAVTVTDINDHTPVFQGGYHNVYRYDVTETHSKQSDTEKRHIATVYAKDDDIGRNAEVRYRINSYEESRLQSPIDDERSKCEPDLVTIDPMSGQITSRHDLDREKIERFHFEVVAYDGGSPSLSTTATVRVTIKDFNDMKPRFMTSPLGGERSYNLHVSENAVAGTFVGAVKAIDGDEGENSKISFEIDTEHTITPKPFTVITEQQGNSGYYIARIRTTQMIDRESLLSGNSRDINPVFNIRLIAKDSGEPPLTSTALLSIHILDVNDETPSFSFPITNASIKVSYLEPADFQIMKMETRDNDAGENGTVRYQIINGNHLAYFAIDEDKGALQLTTDMPKTAIGEYALTIEARDQGSPSKATTTVVYVSIVDGIPLNLKRLQGGRTAVTNLYIIVAIVVGSAVISVVLLTAICIVIRRSRRDTRDAKRADYPLCPNGERRESYDISYPSAGYSTGRREVTFSPNTMDTGSFRLQYQDLTAENKRGSLASNNDKDSGNGDSLDVNSGIGHRFGTLHNHLDGRGLNAPPYTACVTPVMRTFGSTNTSSGLGGSTLGTLEPYTPLSFDNRSNVIMLEDNRPPKKYAIASTTGTLPRRKQSPEASFV